MNPHPLKKASDAKVAKRKEPNSDVDRLAHAVIGAATEAQRIILS